MMKLYYSEGACSVSPHIVLEELGLPYEAVKVSFDDNINVDELKKLNPMGVVPVLVLENGQVLTEGSAIVQYLADLKPESGLAPRAGTFERVRLQEWLGFISTEIHKGFSPIFGASRIHKDAGAIEELRKYALNDLGSKFDVIVTRLGSQKFLMPSGFTVADAYLFAVTNWAEWQKISLDRWPTIVEWRKRVMERPAVQRVSKAEDLF